MKKWIAALIVFGFLFHHYLGEESNNPSYFMMKLQMPWGSRTLTMTAIEKLPPAANCEEVTSTSMTKGLRDQCPQCEVMSRNCTPNLSDKHIKAFNGDVMDTPYFSYDKGGILPQQDFRILFSGIDRAEAGGVCVGIRSLLKNDLLVFLGGRTECVRRSVTR